MGRVTSDYHQKYKQEAKPYANVAFNKDLPYVPRYRYPITQYVGKRTNVEDEDEEDADAFFEDHPRALA